jgi:hypothetical protein
MVGIFVPAQQVDRVAADAQARTLSGRAVEQSAPSHETSSAEAAANVVPRLENHHHENHDHHENHTHEAEVLVHHEG